MGAGDIIAWVSSKSMVSDMVYKLDQCLRWSLGVYRYFGLFLLEALGLHPSCKVYCQDINRV